MKAIERSQKALDLVDRLIKKMDGLDDSPLGALVAARLSEAIGRAQHLNCPDAAAIGVREQDLYQALETWTQYDNWRTIVKG